MSVRGTNGALRTAETAGNTAHPAEREGRRSKLC